jgi:cobalt-zinc-cadmium efflux system outer membrane protein
MSDLWSNQLIRGVVVAAILPAPLAAQRTESPRPERCVTLSEAIQIARSHNIDVRAAQTAIDSARAERRIAGAFPNPVAAGTPNTPYQYSLSLPLDVTPQRAFRERVASLGASATEYDRTDAERQTTLAVSRAFFDALLADERQHVAVQRRDALAQLLRADSSRFRAGDLAERNLTRGEIELARADGDVARARADVQASRTVLQGVMGLTPSDSELTPMGSLDYRRLEIPPDSLIVVARARRPDLRAATTRVDESDAARRMAASLLIPTPTLAVARQFSAPFGNGSYYSLGLALEVPSLNLYGGQRERAAAGAASARLAEQRTRTQIEREVTLAIAEFRVQRALVERYQAGLLTKVADGVAAASYAYSRGAASQLEVLDAVQTERDVRTEYMTALHDYWVSVYAVNAATGADVFGVTR